MAIQFKTVLTAVQFALKVRESKLIPERIYEISDDDNKLYLATATDDYRDLAVSDGTDLVEFLDENEHALIDHTGFPGVPALDGKGKVATGDISEFLNKKIIAGDGIEVSIITPVAVTMTDEEYADYAAFVTGESTVSGSRFSLAASDCDTTNNYFAGVKGSAIVANDIFEDVSNTTAIYIGNGANCYQLSISVVGN